MADDTKVDFFFYYHPNHLGSSNFVTRMLKREASPRHEMYEHVEYIPFGETWIEEREVLPFGASKSNRYLFTSKEFDQETRLYYYGARYYDPKTSIWLSADPALEKYLPTFPTKEKEVQKLTTNPMAYWAKELPGRGGVFNSPNLNVYAYTAQNPVKYVDPDGQWAWVPVVLKEIAKQAGRLMTRSGRATMWRDINTYGSRIYKWGVDKISSGSSKIIGNTYGKLGEVVATKPGQVLGYTKHGLEMLAERGMTKELVNKIVKNPSVVLKQLSGNTYYLTKKGAVVLNKVGKVVTTYGNKYFDPTIKRLLKDAGVK